MDRASWFTPKLRLLRKFAWLALASVPVLAAAIYFKSPALGVPGMLLFVPLMVWLVLVPMFHWKDRYIGTHSGLWGGFMALETSGWSKIYYWFRHVLPDHRAEGRYRDAL